MDRLKYVHGVFTIVIVFLQISQASSSVCQSGWERNGTNCYFFSSSKTDWHSADNDCQDRGAHLASIHSESENTYLSNFNPSMSIWIGINDLIQEGSFLWTDGSAFDFSNWNSGEPNNSGNSEHCVVLNYPGFGAWNDFSCTYLYLYICVKKGSPSSTTAETTSSTSTTLATMTPITASTSGTSLTTILSEKGSPLSTTAAVASSITTTLTTITTIGASTAEKDTRKPHYKTIRSLCFPEMMTFTTFNALHTEYSRVHLPPY